MHLDRAHRDLVIYGPHGTPMFSEERGAESGNGQSAESGDTESKNVTGAPEFSNHPLIRSSEFDRQRYSLQWLVEGVLVANQPAIVGGAKKSLKTNVMVDLGISLGAGLPFLNRFPVERVIPTGFISGESGAATLQETARRIRASKLGIDIRETVDLDDEQVYWGFHLPRLSDDGDLARLEEFIKQHRLEVVIIDPLYLCLNTGKQKAQPGNIYDMGPLLKNLSDTCLNVGATPTLVHHTRKQNSGAKRSQSPPDLDDLAYSGVQEFSRQWILVGRREPYRSGGKHSLWLSCGGSAGFSGLYHVDINEGVVDREFEGRRWTVEVKDAGDEEGGPEPSNDSDRRANEQQRIRDALKEARGGETLTGLRDATGIPTKRIRDILPQLPDVEETKVKKGAGRTPREYDGFHLKPQPVGCDGESVNSESDGQDRDDSAPAASKSASKAHTNGRSGGSTP